MDSMDKICDGCEHIMINCICSYCENCDEKENECTCSCSYCDECEKKEVECVCE